MPSDITEPNIELTPPDRYRDAVDTIRAALLYGPVTDDEWRGVADGWTDEQWSIGAWEAGRCVGHVGAFRFDLVVPGGARLATFGLSRVGVLPTHTRRGLLGAMMRRTLDHARAEGRPLAALRASEATIYGRYGFAVACEAQGMRVDVRRARGLTGGSPGSFRLLRRDEVLGTLVPLYERIAQRPGVVLRPTYFWQRATIGMLAEHKAEYVAVHTAPDGTDDGFVHYSVRWADEVVGASGLGTVLDLWGATPAVELALWSYLLSVDLVASWDVELAPLDQPLPLGLRDPRACSVTARIDDQWLRVLDVEAALAARTYRPTAGVLIAVSDPAFADNNATFSVSSEGVARSPRPPQLSLDIAALSAAYLGGTTFTALHGAGRIDQHEPGGVAAADDLFAHRPAPFCGTFY